MRRKMGGLFVEAWTAYDYIAYALCSPPDTYPSPGQGVVQATSWQNIAGSVVASRNHTLRSILSKAEVSEPR